MSNASSAKLVYGYDFGGYEHGDPLDRKHLPWLTDETIGMATFVRLANNRMLTRVAGFAETDWRVDGYYAREQATKQLLGVWFEIYGSYDFAGYVLTAYRAKAEWGATGVIDFAQLQRRVWTEDWDAKLESALRALEVDPGPIKPGWILCSMYG